MQSSYAISSVMPIQKLYQTSSTIIILIHIKQMDLKDQIHEDFIVDYAVSLGSGTFGDVFRGIWKSKNCFVAVKRIKDHVSKAKEMMDEEVKVMENIKHENILNFLAVVNSEKGTFLIIDYCQGGGLDKEVGKGIPEIDCFKYLKQIVEGMAAVNDSKHIHRDIKPENILFTKQKILKICDFGLARRITGDDPNKIEKFSARGTPLYACPQILRHQKYSGKCDVWSTGILLVEMLTKANPFRSAKNIATLMTLQQKVKNTGGHYVLDGNFNPWFKQIVGKMIAYNEEDRWSFFQLKKKIEEDEDRLLKQYGSFKSIQTTPITKQNAGSENATTLEVPQANQSLLENREKLKMLRKKEQQQTPNGGKASKIEQKLLTKQQNRKLLINLKSYISFLFNRGKLYADIGTKYYHSKQNPKANGYKFMVLFLAVSTLMKSLEKILEMTTKQEVVTLPDGVQIKYAAMDEAIQKEFQESQKSNEMQVRDQIEKFDPLISQIQAKMFSPKYAKEYPTLLINYNDLLQQMQAMKNKTCTKKAQYFSQKFRQFFRRQCVESNIDALHEGFLRVYWLCLNLANAESILPESKYKNHYIIGQIGDDSGKLPIEKIKMSIAELHSRLQD